MSDPFDPMSPFFQDEFIFYEENDNRQQRRRENDGYERQECPDCGEMLKFRSDADAIRCRNCGSRFRVH